MSQSSEINPDLVAKLQRKLREDPAAIIRTYPDVALELADEARLDGHENLADRIEALVRNVSDDQVDST